MQPQQVHKVAREHSLTVRDYGALQRNHWATASKRVFHLLAQTEAIALVGWPGWLPLPSQVAQHRAQPAPRAHDLFLLLLLQMLRLPSELIMYPHKLKRVKAHGRAAHSLSLSLLSAPTLVAF